MLKKQTGLLTLLFTLFTFYSYGQNVAINEDGSLPDPNAILDVKSSNKGILIPRVSTSTRLIIPNTKGLLVYDTTTSSFWYNTGAGWQSIATNTSQGTGGWSLTGNSATTDRNFIGTIDKRPFIVKINNVQSGWLDAVTFNACWGYQAGISNTTGSSNTAIGTVSLRGNTTGSYNTATGSYSLTANSTGDGNTANGFFCLAYNVSGSDNTAVGTGAMSYNIYGSENTASGAYSLKFNTGNYNTANGAWSLRRCNASYNTAIGHSSMYLTETGGANAALGYQALYGNVSGSANTAIGLFALSSVINGGSNTGIGAYSDVAGGSLTNATAIGFNALVSTSNKVRIGNTIVTAIEGAVPFTTLSDGRFKNNVQEDVKGLDFILQLRPVTYNFDTRRFDEQQSAGRKKDSIALALDETMKAAYTEATAIRRTGFIAQEVEKAAFSSGYDFSGIIKPKNEQDHYSLSYESFVVPLVKAVQEQQQLITEQGKLIAELQKQLAELKKQKN